MNTCHRDQIRTRKKLLETKTAKRRVNVQLCQYVGLQFNADNTSQQQLCQWVNKNYSCDAEMREFITVDLILFLKSSPEFTAYSDFLNHVSKFCNMKEICLKEIKIICLSLNIPCLSQFILSYLFSIEGFILKQIRKRVVAQSHC